jgi:hypothetical protein
MSATIHTVSERDGTRSPKRIARIAGIFYLFVAIFGGFAEGFVDPLLYVAGDAAATAGNVVANAGLARIGVVAHVVNGVFLVLVAMTLHQLLNHAQKNAARWMVILAAVAAGITSLNAVFQFEAVQVATDSSYAAAFGIAGSNALVLLLLDIQHYGTLAAQASFGLWLAPMGYLAYRSGLFPKALGAVLVVATISYLVHLVVAFLVPGLGGQTKPLFAIAPLIAEVWMLGYLLLKGVRTPRIADRGIVASGTPMPA